MSHLTSGILPNLKIINITGFSLGSQFMNRYSLATTWGGPLQKAHVKVRFIMANAGSYFYLSEERPDPSCRPAKSLEDKTFTCSKFAKPSKDDPYSIYKNFDRYNSGKYGLGNGKKLFVGYKLKDKNWISNYVKKDAYIFIGSHDNCSCGLENMSNSPYCAISTVSCSKNKSPLLKCCDVIFFNFRLILMLKETFLMFQVPD
jgi:hypothetical protein